MYQGGLAGPVHVAGRLGPPEAARAGGGDELALQQPVPAGARRVRVAGGQQGQERDEGKVRPGHVDGEDLVRVLERRHVPQLLLELGGRHLRRPGRERGDGPEIAGVGDEQVDERCLFLDGLCRSQQRCFRAGVAHDGDEGVVFLGVIHISLRREAMAYEDILLLLQPPSAWLLCGRG